MSHHEDRIRLLHMLDACREALAITTGKTSPDLRSDRVLELALTRLLEVIGEAASRVSADTRRQAPTIPWAEIVGLRNRLIHGYDSVDLAILWDIIQYEPPQLRQALEQVLEE